MSGSRSNKQFKTTIYLLLALVGFAVLVWFATPPGTDDVGGTAVVAELRPVEEPAAGFVKSERCQDCHQKHHDSWHASYHRTMTQVARADLTMGTFSNQVVSIYEGRERYQLFQHEGLPWVRRLRNAEPPGPQDPSREAVPIVLMTGSHHMQVYWMPTGKGRQLAMMPLIYLRERKRWIPRAAAFLQPPESGTVPEVGRWNVACIRCHTTDGRMNVALGEGIERIDSKVSQFGIACEACHGPGEKHIAFHEQKSSGHDPIVNPSTVSHRRSAQVCGQCHSVNANPGHPSEWTAFRVGKDLEKERLLLDYNEKTRSWLASWHGDVNPQQLETADAVLAQTFWKDGTPRVSGREYSGLRKSACFIAGEMSCISCHTAHPNGLDESGLRQWSDDMLRPGARGDQACLQCHESDSYATESHTHHAAASIGSSCQNCHMPHTMYGLLKGIRSHTIQSPSVGETTQMGRPNACNLCHLDQTLAWTASHMERWYGQKQPELSTDQKNTAAGALWALTGDAGTRALVAWHMGWQPAQQASKHDWMAPFLANLLDDEYDAVRFIASRLVRSR
ncbi:MAG: multiheme c-type cytochrome, partial [Limisphaerales bacterium]